MADTRLPVKDIPAEGREFAFDDQEIWRAPRAEFGLDWSELAPLAATLSVLPRPRGVFLRGRLTGALSMPCDRCTAPARVDIDADFELADELPAPGEPAAEDTWLRETRNGLELDVAGLLWEQFVLALPTHVLCRPDCKGLCPLCGADLNQAPCSCRPLEGDARLAALRGFKVRPKD